MVWPLESNYLGLDPPAFRCKNLDNSVFPHLHHGNNDLIYRVVWRLNNSYKCLEQCMAHSKHTTSTSYHHHHLTDPAKLKSKTDLMGRQ